jgi:hypothetical protein
MIRDAADAVVAVVANDSGDCSCSCSCCCKPLPLHCTAGGSRTTQAGAAPLRPSRTSVGSGAPATARWTGAYSASYSASYSPSYSPWNLGWTWANSSQFQQGLRAGPADRRSRLRAPPARRYLKGSQRFLPPEIPPFRDSSLQRFLPPGIPPARHSSRQIPPVRFLPSEIPPSRYLRGSQRVQKPNVSTLYKWGNLVITKDITAGAFPHPHILQDRGQVRQKETSK